MAPPRKGAIHAVFVRRYSVVLRKKDRRNQGRFVRCYVLWLPFVKPSVGDPRLAINESISLVISDSWTNNSEPSSRRNLQPSRCPPAPNSISYARLRLGSNGRLIRKA